MSAPAAVLRPAASLRRGQLAVILLLFGGYAACYFCRADLSVSTPLLIDELARRGVKHDDAIVHLGTIASLGVLAYAFGKLFLTGLGDYWGGRLNFLIGLAGAAVFTALFAAGGILPIFTIAWMGNRLTQSVAWAGLIKTSSRWFDYSSYGTIIGILSISYLVGDAVARWAMGLLMAHGSGWRVIFYFAAAVAGVMLAANYLLLRESRTELGFTEARTNPLNLFADRSSRPASIRSLLGPLLRSRAFQLVCLLSLGCTIVRESFNLWTPAYLHSYLGYVTSSAATVSAVFPAVGAVSVLVTGWLSDRLGVYGRSLVMFLGLGATTVSLLFLMSIHPDAAATWLPVIVIGVIAFCLLGPYSYLCGAFALDFGGAQASAISSGIIDGVGYLGGILSGNPLAELSVRYGWQGVFVALAGVTALSALAAGYLFLLSIRSSARLRPEAPSGGT